MTTVLVVNCNTSTEMTDDLVRSARLVAAPGTTVVGATPSWGVASAEGYYDSFLSAASVLDLLAGWSEPFDAAVLAGFGEHGREGARQLLAVPVVDITEAAVLAALLVGSRFGVVTTTAASVEQIRGSLIVAGLADRSVGVLASHIRVADITVDPAASVGTLVTYARELISAGADCIVLGCAGMTTLRTQIERELGVPVVDGVTAAVAFCESLVRLGLRTSKAGPYAFPDPTKSRPARPVQPVTGATR